MDRFKLIAALGCTALLAGSGGYVLAQQGQATGHASGLHPTELARVDLGKYFPSMNGKWMLMERVDVDPGAGSTPHSHNKHPEVVYILKGSMVETQGAEKHTIRAGEGQRSNANMNEKHQLRNVGKVEASVLDVGILCSTGQGDPNKPRLEDCGRLGINN